MSFKKIASAEVIGISHKGNWSRKASKRYSSIYMDSDKSIIDMEAALDSVADVYAISRNPNDYLLIPVRANSSDRPNENLDGFQSEELLRYEPRLSKKVFETYLLKPHFVNHNSANFVLSRGALLDSYYNDLNPADDETKQIIFDATGKEVSNDEFVEVLIAIDTTKDPILAEAYRNGSVYRFSMGCDVDGTVCSECGNVATNVFEFCDHIKNKMARRRVKNKFGRLVIPFEWCIGTIFAELSAVDDPADKTAEIQEGILGISEVVNNIRMQAGNKLGNINIQEVVEYMVRNSNSMPDSLIRLVNNSISF